MFYVKEHINSNVEVKIDIDSTNVYCICPRCGQEQQVDLNDFFGDEDFNLDVHLFCDECQSKL